jgi:hypothetical protein
MPWVDCFRFLSRLKYLFGSQTCYQGMVELSVVAHQLGGHWALACHHMPSSLRLPSVRIPFDPFQLDLQGSFAGILRRDPLPVALLGSTLGYSLEFCELIETPN